MARRQTRRTISLSTELVASVSAHAQSLGLPVAYWVDLVLCAALLKARARIVSREEAVERQRAKRTANEQRIEKLHEAAFGYRR